MAENSKIEWTHHTANLWWGCEEVHQGCDNCYARIFANRFTNNLWGPGAYRKEINSVWNKLSKFQRNAAKYNEMHRVFVGSMMDVFEVPKPLATDGVLNSTYTDSLRNLLFRKIEEQIYPNLIFLLLTKRPQNINKYIPDSWKVNPPRNVFFGATAVNQQTFNYVTRHLLEVKGKRFLSIEPQLEAIQLNNIKGIDWIIQGGESGQRKRSFNLDWAKTMREDCKELNIPYFFKQIDKIQAIPKDMLVRDFPQLEKLG